MSRTICFQEAVFFAINIGNRIIVVTTNRRNVIGIGSNVRNKIFKHVPVGAQKSDAAIMAKIVFVRVDILLDYNTQIDGWMV